MMNVVIVFPLLILISAAVLLPILIGVYVYRDANRRGMNAVLWTLIAILAPSLIGFIIYLLVRGNYSDLRCSRCDGPVSEQYVVCPKCGAKLRPSCPSCAAPVEPDWTVCPKCTQPLPAVQDDVAPPVRPKDKTLWKILVVIVVVPVLLILALGIGFTAASGGGSSSMHEVSLDEYFADGELPETTKAYVREWLEGIPRHGDHVYALQYEYQFDPESDTRDHFYLLYVPGGGDVGRTGFGYSSGLFGGTFKLDLEDPGGRDGLYCVATTSKRGAPRLSVTLDGRRLTADVTEVDFNPTLYIIASATERPLPAGAHGDLYIQEIVPDPPSE